MEDTPGAGPGGPLPAEQPAEVDWQSGQEDWRSLRAEGWNKGGIRARTKRMVLRMHQELLNKQRAEFGLPCPEGTLQEQVRADRLAYLNSQLQETMVFRAGLEKAAVGCSQSSNEFQAVGQSLSPSPAIRMVSGIDIPSKAAQLQHPMKVPPANAPPPPETGKSCQAHMPKAPPPPLVLPAKTAVSAPPASLVDFTPQSRIVFPKCRPPSPFYVHGIPGIHIPLHQPPPPPQLPCGQACPRVPPPPPPPPSDMIEPKASRNKMFHPTD